MKTKGQRQSTNVETKPKDTHRPPNGRVPPKDLGPFKEDKMTSMAGLDKMDDAMERDQEFFKHTIKDH